MEHVSRKEQIEGATYELAYELVHGADAQEQTRAMKARYPLVKDWRRVQTEARRITCGITGDRGEA